MEKIKLICPNCHTLLYVKFAVGISDKILTCPKCSYRAKVYVYQQQALDDGKHGGVDDDGPTQVATEMRERTIGSLFYGTEEYSLHKGQNTIGRRTKIGGAEVQISDDLYMGRQYAVITIKETDNGFEHLLQPKKAKNPIRINGIPLQDDDIVVLHWGDRLIFGHTELIFDQPDNK